MTVKLKVLLPDLAEISLLLMCISTYKNPPKSFGSLQKRPQRENPNSVLSKEYSARAARRLQEISVPPIYGRLEREEP